MASSATKRRRTEKRKVDQQLFLLKHLETYCRVSKHKPADIRKELVVTRRGWNDFRNTVDQLIRTGVMS